MTILLVLLAIALFVAVLVTQANARREAALRAEVERAQRVAEEARCVTPSAAQPKARRRVRK